MSEPARRDMAMRPVLRLGLWWLAFASLGTAAIVYGAYLYRTIFDQAFSELVNSRGLEAYNGDGTIDPVRAAQWSMNIKQQVAPYWLIIDIALGIGVGGLVLLYLPRIFGGRFGYLSSLIGVTGAFGWAVLASILISIVDEMRGIVPVYADSLGIPIKFAMAAFVPACLVGVVITALYLGVGRYVRLGAWNVPQVALQVSFVIIGLTLLAVGLAMLMSPFTAPGGAVVILALGTTALSRFG
jgi:hypothetical protein